MITVCQACGALENPQLLIFCSTCNTNAEHQYCLNEYEECHGDFVWSCEECTQPVIPTTSVCQEEGISIQTNDNLIPPALSSTSRRPREEIGDIRESSKKKYQKNTRGKNKDHTYHHPPVGEKFKVIWNHSGEPVCNKAGKSFKTKLGMIARRNNIFPIDKSWKEQTQESMDNALKEIEAEFDYNDNPQASRYINLKMNKFWRNNYTILVEKFAFSDLSDSEIVQSIPLTVDSQQFLRRLRYFESEDGQKKSKQNKVNRSNQMSHHGGSKSCSDRAYELIQKGMSEEDAWLQVMEITYHNQEKIANVIKYVRGEEGEKFMKSESISKIDLIKYSLEKVVGKNNKNRYLARGEMANLSKNTPARFFRNVSKGKSIDESSSQPDNWEEKMEDRIVAKVVKALKEELRNKEINKEMHTSPNGDIQSSKGSTRVPSPSD